MQQGYLRRIDNDREANNEAWRRARFAAYHAIKAQHPKWPVSIVDFMPLPGDKIVDVAANEQEALAAIEEAKKRGLLKVA